MARIKTPTASEALAMLDKAGAEARGHLISAVNCLLQMEASLGFADLHPGEQDFIAEAASDYAEAMELARKALSELTSAPIARAAALLGSGQCAPEAGEAESS
jgi:hypothetical protein